MKGFDSSAKHELGSLQNSIHLEIGEEFTPPMHNDLGNRRRDWKKIHHSPLFWLGFVLFLAAITIYVLSNDLSWRPHLH